ncbi:MULTISPECIES: hypothetical protein [unclassified Marinobacter]|uniref:hypothetical protein n=1 Tax=unclassified Marinobacter TaxID=83889 RepID=UPI000C923ED5|nr:MULTISPECIES: hypothetical protein [unclassified Marinobacter]MAC21373.1 hypothetical protein [Marinobacter sp.]HCL38750.1 hypothetical protein [Marinobacter nauticus]|tara:strand:- start:3918 stop:4739 length:822 start_codon:yes stop_codon:yes gene_type:complete
MKLSPENSALGRCEVILMGELSYNLEHKILASENTIINRLIMRSRELQRAYAELEDRLGNDNRAISTFLRILLSSAAFWCPEKNAEARKNRKRLEDVNEEIASLASLLANLLDERSGLHNHTGFSSGEIYDLCSATEAATKDHHMFQSYPRTEFRRLFAQYDGKYWPSLSQVIRAVGEDAASPEIYATDPLTEAGTTGARASQADFFRAWFASIEENSLRYSGFLPVGFRLSDESMAALADCALDNDPNKPTGSEYIKRLRQRAREAQKGLES